MKLCVRAQRIWDDGKAAADSDDKNVRAFADRGDPRVDGMRAVAAGTRTGLARALNRHLASCRECSR